MNKVEILISQLCPDGVPSYPLQEVFSIRNGYTPSKSNSKFWTDGTVPWFRMEDIQKNGRLLNSAIQCVHESALKSAGVYEAYSIIMSTSATIGEHAMIEVPFLANQRFTVLTRKREFVELLRPKFAYYLMFGLAQFCKENTTMSSFAGVEMAKFRDFTIQIPPIRVQDEVIRILDTFTELEAELEAELDVRKTQFDHLRTELIRRYSENCSPLPLGSLITYLRTGLNPRQNFVLNPPGATCAYITVRELDGFKVRPSEKTDRVDERGFNAIQNRSRLQSGDVLFSATGTIGRTALVEETPTNWGIKEGVYAISTDPTQLDPRFLIYLIGHSAIYDEIIARSEGSTVRSISMASLKSLQLKLPPLTVQKRITEILDVAHELVFQSLPGEINARRKQYEYYRSKLLTFKQLDVA
jgi:type I restriction enzyme, S subunit